MHLTEHNCITCGELLTEENWYLSFVDKRMYKCKTCYDQRRIENRRKKEIKEKKKPEIWTRKEIDIAVNHYFRKYVKEYHGEKMNETNYWKNLFILLPQKDRIEIETKYQNISGILTDQGLKRIEKYKPKKEYLKLSTGSLSLTLVDSVLNFINKNQNIKYTLSNKQNEGKDNPITIDFEVRGFCISPISRHKLQSLKKLSEKEGFLFNPKQKCSRPTVNNSPCCKEHQYRVSEVLSKWPMTDVLMQKYWEEGLDLLNFDKDITLTMLFKYIKGSFLDLHRINLSDNKIVQWYRTTQKKLGHPVEVLDNHYSHLIGKTGYLEVWKKFGKGELKTSRERVVEYLTKHPGSVTSKVHKKTKVDYNLIYKYVEEEKLNLGAKAKDELKIKILDYVKKNPDIPAELVAHNFGTTKSTVVKHCKQNNIHVEGMKEKPSMYKRKITDRWK